MNKIVIKNLTKSFSDKKHSKDLLFDNLNLNIKNNQISVIMAPSGYGKTTLFRMIMNVDKNYKGEILIKNHNEDLTLAKKYKDKIMLFQEDRLIDNASVLTNLKISTRINNNEKLDKIVEYLIDFKLENAKDKKIKDLSGGMKRRVALIKCLMQEKSLVLLDEPLNGLDAKNKEQVIEILKNYQKKNKCTILVIVHDINDALSLAEKENIIKLDEIH